MQKKFSQIDIFCLVIGSVIGYGAFFLPGQQFLPQSGIINTTIGLAIGVLMMSLIQSAYQIMMTRHQEAGGEFSYAYQYLGKRHGAIVALSLIIGYMTMIPLNASAIPAVLAYAGFHVHHEGLVAFIVILLFTWINIRGFQLSTRIQNMMSGLLVLIVVGLGLVMWLTQPHQSLPYHAFSLSEIMSVVAIVPFLFVGFDVIPQVSIHLGFSVGKTHTLALGSLTIGALLYALLNLMAALGGQNVLPSVLAVCGPIGYGLLLIALLAAVVGGINGFFIAASQLVAAVSQYGLLPSKLAQLNARGVPAYAIGFVGFLACLFPWFGRSTLLVIINGSSILVALAYGYVCWISYRLSKKKVCLLACLVCLFMMTGFLW